MPWFKKNNDEAKVINFSLQSIVDRLRKKTSKWYQVEVSLTKDGKVIGKFPMTIQAYGRNQVQTKVQEGLKLEATKISVLKQKPLNTRK